MRLSALLFAVIVMASSALEARRARAHSARWIVQANGMPAGNAFRTDEGYFRIGTVIPAKLYRPTQNISVVVKKSRFVTIPADRLMVRLEDDPRSFCELKSSRGSAFDCFTDTDGDGKVDTFFGTQVFNEIFLGSIGDDGGFTPLAGPVELAELDPRTNTPMISLELKYDGMSGNVVKYRVCMNTSWESKFYGERSCQRRSMQAQLDSTGSAVIFGQKIRFEGVRGKPPTLYIEYSQEDFEFPTTFSLF